MKRQGIAESLRDAIAEEMERDETVFCIGEDIAVETMRNGADDYLLKDRLGR